MSCGEIPSRWLCACVALACLLGEAGGLSANHISSRYESQQWSSETSFAGEPIRAITQTPDGYLWIGTSKRVVRFDGFSFQPAPLSNPEFRNDPILGLTVDSGGRLCVLFWGAGILCYRDAKGENLVLHNGASPIQIQVTASSLEKDGSMLVADILIGILRIHEGVAEVLLPRPLFAWSSLIIAMARTGDGKIWLGTLADGLFSVSDGRTTQVTAGLETNRIHCLLPVGEKELWVGTDKGVFRGDGTSFRRVPLPPSAAGAQVLTMLQDRNKSIWLGTTVGLLRIDPDGVLSSEATDSGNGSVNALFEDREGDLWVGGERGVERIRESTFVTYSVENGMAQQRSPVYADVDNRVWFASAAGGINLLQQSQIQREEPAFLKHADIYSITGNQDEIWVGTQYNGLIRFQYRDGIRNVRTYTDADGVPENSVYSVYQGRDGAVWAGTLTGGVSRLKDGQFVSYTTANGLVSNTVSSIFQTRDGAIWFATPNGLSSLSGNKWTTYTVRDGLPSDTVNCLLEDSSGVLWVGTSGGLAFVNSGHVQVPRTTNYYLHEETLGVAEDKQGWLWIATSNRVLRVRADNLSRGTLSSDDIREYGPADGLNDAKVVKRDRSVVAGSDGRIWFSTDHGVLEVDPSRMSVSSAPAIVHVEEVSADGKTIGMMNARVPPRPQRITLSYTGLSLANPGRIRFRYTLEGFDHGWSEPVDARAAVYTNLGPGSYRFRIVARNSDGVWNGPETLFPFEVEPAIWQTMWFRTLCLVAITAMVLLAYQWRLRQMARQWNLRFDERLAERTRIAQELHDTLLQSFQGLMLRFQGANEILLSNPSEAKEALEGALDRADQALTESRRAIQGIRTDPFSDHDLEHALRAIMNDLAADELLTKGKRPTTSVVVEGKPRNVDPGVREEICKIAREAFRNAFTHGDAQHIESEIAFSNGFLRVRFRDDGVGMDAVVLKEGVRAGHWGLTGMKERAKRLRGQLNMWSKPGAGTEVELMVPAHVAFEPGPSWVPLKKKRGETRSTHDERA